MAKVLSLVEKYILYITLAVLPVFILLNSTSPAILSKTQLLFVAGGLVLILWVVRMFIKGTISFAFGRFDAGIILMIIAFVVSAVMMTPNKMEAFFVPGVAALLVISAVFYFLANQLDKKGKEGMVLALLSSGVLLSLSVILTELGLFAKIPQLPTLVKDPLFNPLGGLVPTIVYLTTLLFLGARQIIKEKELAKRVFWVASMGVMLVAAVVIASKALPGKPQAPKFPSFQTSWEIAISALGKSPVLGVGPSNYLSAFNLYRPVSYNQTDLWNVRFTTANNFYLTMLTETGLLGLLALVVLLFPIYKSIAKGFKTDYLAPVSLLLVLAVLPLSPVLFAPLFILLALISGSEEHVVTLNTIGAKSSLAGRIPAIIIGILVLAGIGAAGYYGFRIMAAEVTFAKSLAALSANNAKITYEDMQKAINQNPRVDRYHTSLAQIDMALAQSLSTKKDLTDDDKKTITQLVQQSINEGKAGVTLNPGRSGNWEVLAQIYRTIMPFAQGADNFAIQTYTQAVALDPTNPNLRIALGGVYYALGRYDDAVDAFKLAVLVKPDLANAHYNLAVAYREKKNFDAAITEMNSVLALVDKDSSDYALAKKTLEDLEKNKPSTTAPAGENLTAPQKPAETSVKPPITLPSDSTPPQTNP